VILPI